MMYNFFQELHLSYHIDLALYVRYTVLKMSQLYMPYIYFQCKIIFAYANLYYQKNFVMDFTQHVTCTKDPYQTLKPVVMATIVALQVRNFA